MQRKPPWPSSTRLRRVRDLECTLHGNMASPSPGAAVASSSPGFQSAQAGSGPPAQGAAADPGAPAGARRGGSPAAHEPVDDMADQARDGGADGADK
jgi:hypothetical protein